MAEKINDGGPVFPCEIETTSKGIALRDYFAAKVMQSYLLDKDRDSFTFEQWAKAAYAMADAMLQARGQA